MFKNEFKNSKLLNISFYACLLFVYGLKSAVAYTPPVGIPDPSWGSIHPIDTVAPAQPAAWPSTEAPGYYYIDNTHGAATDSANPYGTPNRPRMTIPEITYSAGSYVEIHGGPYTGGGQLILTANGTEANPVWIRGSSPATKPTIRGETILKGSYIFVENLYYDTDQKGIGLRVHSGSNLHHVVVRNVEMTGSGNAVGFNSAISITGSDSNRFHDIVIYNNHIHNLGDHTAAAAENDYHGVAPSSNFDRVWILDNHIHHMGGDSVQVGVASIPDTARGSHVYIGNNEFHDDHENAVDIKEVNNVVVSSNLTYGYEGTGSSSGSIIVAHNNPDNIWIINNTVHSGWYGIVTTGSTNTWFIGNTVYNIHKDPAAGSWNPTSAYATGSAIHFRGSSTGGAINNTIHNYDIGMQLLQGTASGYTILNNILANRSEPSGLDINLVGTSLASNSTMDNNAFFNTDNGLRWGNSTTYTVEGTKLFANSCLSCIELSSTPFKNASIFDFELNSNSSAINNGVDHSIYDTYFGLFGKRIDKDLKGKTRVMGASIDIGSLESGNSPAKIQTINFNN